MEAAAPGVKDDEHSSAGGSAEIKPARSRRSKQANAAVPEAWLLGAVEAVVLSLNKPVPIVRLAESLSEWRSRQQNSGGEVSSVEAEREPPIAAVSPAMVEAAVEMLNATYAETGRAFRIEHVAGGVRLMTVSAFADAVGAFHQSRTSQRLSRPAVETLAIIAYKQPVTRAHLEAIRGVSCGEVLKSLLERQLVVVTGRAEELGRPLLYGTGPKFLTSFGLDSIKDLPSPEEGTPSA